MVEMLRRGNGTATQHHNATGLRGKLFRDIAVSYFVGVAGVKRLSIVLSRSFISFTNCSICVSL